MIMITAYASLETAVTATRRGAYDFLAKPFTPEELRGAVRKAARHLILQRQARRLAEEKRQVRFQFISVLAHEMKAPIAAIEGYLQMIRERALGESLGDLRSHGGPLSDPHRRHAQADRRPARPDRHRVRPEEAQLGHGGPGGGSPPGRRERQGRGRSSEISRSSWTCPPA